MKRFASVVAAALAGGVLTLLWVPPAGADTEGPCTASVDGQDVSGRSASDPDDAIEVDADAVIEVEATSTSPIGSYAVEMEFAGFSWEVAADEATGTSWQETVEVKDYSRFGVGLYKVRAVSSGAVPCAGEVLVKVTGKSLFTTPAGLAGLALTAGGVAGVAASARRGVAA